MAAGNTDGGDRRGPLSTAIVYILGCLFDTRRDILRVRGIDRVAWSTRS
jgi:hypothetical protein